VLPSTTKKPLFERSSFEFLILFLKLNAQINSSLIEAKKEKKPVDLFSIYHTIII